MNINTAVNGPYVTTTTNAGIYGGMNGGMTAGMFPQYAQCMSCGASYPISQWHDCPQHKYQDLLQKQAYYEQQYKKPEPKKEEKVLNEPVVASTFMAAIEIAYRFPNGRIRTALMKGMTDEEAATAAFMNQFDGEEDDVKIPTVLAAEQVLISG